MVKPDKAAAME